MAERKEYWSSRTTFLLASIGAAIGIGNVWRFPYICYSNGGGAFFIPYIIALATAGIPLLMLEFGLGYKEKSAPPLSFRTLVGPKYEWIGWLSVLVGFAIIIYYCIIMAWAVDYAWFSTTLAWGADSEAFFFDTFLRLPDSLFDFSDINLLIVVGALVSWLWIYIAIIKGVKSVEKMVWVTVLAPWILILIFVIRGLTLPGAFEGIAFYLTPDFSVLANPDVWLAAYGQIFFTLSIGWGVMIAYASFLPVGSDLAKNAVIIAVANSLTSFVAGFAVFSTLGYLAYQAGVPVTGVVQGGIELAFVTYPTVISLLPFAPELFGVLFFFMLVTLGVDSAFSTVEAFTVAVRDEFGGTRWRINALVCTAGVCMGLIFATRSGYYWLDIVDYYLSAFLLVIVGFLEAVAVAYIYGPSLLRRFISDHSDFRVGRWWEICIKFIVPGFLVIALGTSIWERIQEPYGGYPFVADAMGWMIVILIPLLSVLIAWGVQRRKRYRKEEMF
jgi:NSS family neurotransmitter:Na+ symporter